MTLDRYPFAANYAIGCIPRPAYVLLPACLSSSCEYPSAEGGDSCGYSAFHDSAMKSTVSENLNYACPKSSSYLNLKAS